MEMTTRTSTSVGITYLNDSMERSGLGSVVQCHDESNIEELRETIKAAVITSWRQVVTNKLLIASPISPCTIFK